MPSLSLLGEGLRSVVNEWLKMDSVINLPAFGTTSSSVTVHIQAYEKLPHWATCSPFRSNPRRETCRYSGVDPFPSTPVPRAKPLTFDCQPFIKSRVADAETLQQIAAVERCGAPKIT